MESGSRYGLFEEIIGLSRADNWNAAKKEWILDKIIYIEKGEEPSACLCGHYPIKELCILRNKINKNEAIVGNCCVNKFLEIETRKIFSAIAKNKVNSAVIEYAHEHDIINDWERRFMLNVWRKRKLSPKQKPIYGGIKKRILGKCVQ